MTTNRVLQRVDISLRTFYVFNSKFCKIEGEEHKKVLYYYPEETEPNTQIRDVGLSEAIIQFTGTFAEEDDCKALHTQKTTQLLYQPEPGYWMVMVLNVPKEVHTKDGVEVAEYRGNEVHDRIYRATLKHCYQLYRLHKGTFCMNLKEEDNEGHIKLESLQVILREFFNAHLPHLKLANCDFLHLSRSVQYLPLDKNLFLRAHNLVNMIRATFPVIKETILLYNEQVICSGKVDPNDLYSLHDHIFCSLLVPDTPAAPRGSRTAAEQFCNGVFITGAEESEQCSLAPRIFVKINTLEPLYLIVYRALNAIFCLLVDGSIAPPTNDFYTELHAYMAPQLISIANDIGESITKQQSIIGKSSDADNNTTKYLYINEQSLKHLTNIPFEKRRIRGEGCIPAHILNVIADLNNAEGSDIENDLSPLQEVQVKTTNNFWIVKRRWNWRQCYVIIFNSKATLLDVTQEVKRLFEREFTDDVFFDK